MLRSMVVAAGLTLAAGLLAPGGAAAQSSVTVFGSSKAQSCYQAARSGLGIAGEADCSAALQEPGLGVRDRAATLVNRGIIRNAARRLAEALEDFNEALRLDPALGEAFLNRGNSYFFQRRFPEALSDYGRAIELGTRDLHAAYFNRALVYEVLREKEKARADLEQALALGFEPARARLAASYYAGPSAPQTPAPKPR